MSPILPTSAVDRKNVPAFSGFVAYFPKAMMAVARLSKIGNDQHNPGEPLHWAKEKSTDHLDCLIRHAAEHGTFDTDGCRHMVKAAWRAMAELETELDRAIAAGEPIFREDLIPPAPVPNPMGKYPPPLRSAEQLDLLGAANRKFPKVDAISSKVLNIPPLDLPNILAGKTVAPK